ncbi:hypothetical protein C9374_008013 [Naegleria lovaniensis]|uniref:Uncharacterized protein n=1 Tax=Naegleria lovaniensis TaxID=51637 RepID=A0AA88KGT0_NAELO|nr:uncharacterized protein C9374_008013 [Naegleria lovaniensis]KAG2378865.1 hypothetical protein C9374_008013 [Naegleria lovaniensis]
MFSFALSKFFSSAAEDDLEKFSASRNIFSNTFPKEVLINIVSFMELGTIYVFARADRFLLKFLFDQTPESIEKLSNTKNTQEKSRRFFDNKECSGGISKTRTPATSF